MTGRTISHYVIGDKLGSGGMGVVYEAVDTRLRRPVALKFLPPHLNANEEAKARFIQEAQSASALDHTNICNIHEIAETSEGDLYIAMAYYKGQTLKYRLANETFSVERCIDIARQLVRGLGRAHEAGIIHRDIKPANIMLTNRGEVKLLDFGLAKLMDVADLTQAGETLGTAAYMSPEQARGEETGRATDVWSTGVVIYEMLTGRRPFSGQYDQAVIYAILNQEPTNAATMRPDLPAELDGLIAGCLQKNIDKRWTLDQVQAALETGATGSETAIAGGDRLRVRTLSRQRLPIILASAAVALVVLLGVVWMLRFLDDQLVGEEVGPPRKSIAVLPLTTRSPNEEDVYFAGGMHDDILTQLAKIGELTVISRTSVMQYENTAKPIRQIGQELGVASVLEGGLDRVGDRVRINVQLIDAQTDEYLWAETYDEKLTAAKVSAIRTDLARAIAAALKATLTPEEQQSIVTRPTESLEAYDAYTRGLYLANSAAFSNEKLLAAAELFEEALVMDRAFAAPHARLASVYLELWNGGMMSADEALPIARRHAEKSLELDAQLADGHIGYGQVLMAELNYDDAEIAFRKAIALSPGLSRSHGIYARFLLARSRYKEALDEAMKSIELDPLDLRSRRRLSDAMFFSGDFDGSVRETQKILELAPDDHYSYYNLGYAKGMLRQFDESLAALQKASEMAPDAPYYAMGVAWGYARANQRDSALAIMNSVHGGGGILKEKAIVLAELGDLEEAFETLDAAYAEDPGLVANMGHDPSVPVGMRDDERFAELMKKLGVSTED